MSARGALTWLVATLLGTAAGIAAGLALASSVL